MTGGLAIGLALILIDLLLNNVKGFGGGKGADVTKITEKDNVEYKSCALRTVLWPGNAYGTSELLRKADLRCAALAAGGGVVGVMLW